MAYVMVVDDDEDFGTIAATVLRDAGHEVDVETDPHSALQSMEKRPPDLAILDVIFPEDMSAGFELARAMHCDPGKLKHVPILMLTAVSSMFPLGFGAHDIDNAALPVADFLEKPVDLDVLVDHVSALLERASAGDGGEETQSE
jgi:CheY-like chemotaxis protein